MARRIGWTGWLGNFAYLILAALLIVAGTKLLRGTRDSIDWSNRYALTSLSWKAVWLAITVMIIWPAKHQVFSSNPALEHNRRAVAIMVAAMDLGFGIYPLLTLVLLNRPRVKSWAGGLE